MQLTSNRFALTIALEISSAGKAWPKSFSVQVHRNRIGAGWNWSRKHSICPAVSKDHEDLSTKKKKIHCLWSGKTVMCVLTCGHFISIFTCTKGWGGFEFSTIEHGNLPFTLCAYYLVNIPGFSITKFTQLWKIRNETVHSPSRYFH